MYMGQFDITKGAKDVAAEAGLDYRGGIEAAIATARPKVTTTYQRKTTQAGRVNKDVLLGPFRERCPEGTVQARRYRKGTRYMVQCHPVEPIPQAAAPARAPDIRVSPTIQVSPAFQPVISPQISPVMQFAPYARDVTAGTSQVAPVDLTAAPTQMLPAPIAAPVDPGVSKADIFAILAEQERARSEREATQRAEERAESTRLRGEEQQRAEQRRIEEQKQTVQERALSEQRQKQDTINRLAEQAAAYGISLPPCDINADFNACVRQYQQLLADTKRQIDLEEAKRLEQERVISEAQILHSQRTGTAPPMLRSEAGSETTEIAVTETDQNKMPIVLLFLGLAGVGMVAAGRKGKRK